MSEAPGFEVGSAFAFSGKVEPIDQAVTGNQHQRGSYSPSGPSGALAESIAETLAADSSEEVAEALATLKRASGAAGAAVVIDEETAPPWVYYALGPPPPGRTLDAIDTEIAEARGRSGSERELRTILLQDQNVFIARLGDSASGVAVGLPSPRLEEGGLHRLCSDLLLWLWPRLAAVLQPPRFPSQPPKGALVLPPGYASGDSPAIRELHGLVQQLASSDLPLLIAGETGVGKELVARLVHESSNRRTGEFLALNCAALPLDLFESELFGIGSGVASGVSGRSGLLQHANGGTLLLDEIGDLPPLSQTKLLRALQEKSVRPLGRPPVDIDVRVLSATNSDLKSRVAAGSFRLDLYHRVAGCVLTVPPLRERVEDIPILVDYVLRREARSRPGPRGLTLQAMSALCRYSWPGNVRELENRVRTLCHLVRPGEVITLAFLPPEIRCVLEYGSNADEESDLAGRVAAFERQEVQRALVVHGGNKTKTALSLGVSRNGLLKKLKRLGIETPAPDG